MANAINHVFCSQKKSGTLMLVFRRLFLREIIVVYSVFVQGKIENPHCYFIVNDFLKSGIGVLKEVKCVGWVLFVWLFLF
ncbi:hypothetical protein SAMN05444274_102165 [Mariniphaga anaerophila]|uniref:Uncharacterized protein n=1 Tax=Mariniphaga anaerophila TaxID=1484053 RepID=A0A1M4VPB4_9BACT|nr:hypothetical protein SAMN05444274_102165 [Mariniphaga anaerophila]